MRKCFIRFVEGSVYIRDLDSERNYFFIEAEKMIDELRMRFAKEKRTVDRKEFEFWIDGQLAVRTHVDFEKKITLQRQLEEAISIFDSWEEEFRKDMIGRLRNYVEEEKQLFVNREFYTFAKRFDEIFGKPSYALFPLLLEVTQLHQLYSTMQKSVTTSFYAELEQMIRAIDASIQNELSQFTRKLQNDEEPFESMKERIEKAVYQHLEQPEVFSGFSQYALAYYQSVPKNRIIALCPHFPRYQDFEKWLFQTYAKMSGFDTAQEIHRRLLKTFEEKYDDILASGFALRNDEAIETLILDPVLQEFRLEVQNGSDA